MARPSTTVQAISDFIAGCKADGVWSKITEAYLMAGVTFGGITVKLKGTGTLTNNNFVSGDYQATGAGAGLTGDGSTKYIDTGLNDNTLNADNKSFGVYITNFLSGASKIGVSGPSPSLSDNDLWNIFVISSSNIGFRLPSSSASILFISGDTESFLIASRRDINDAEVYINGVSKGTDTTTSAAANAQFNWYLFGFNPGGGTTNPSDATLTFAHIGTGLTDTDASNLTNRVETLMDALGCGVIS
jgi:hypothetical protein